MSSLYTHTHTHLHLKIMLLKKTVPIDLLNTGLSQAFHLQACTLCDVQENKVCLYPKWEPSQLSKIQKLQTGTSEI